jgi:cytochrome c553
MRRTLILSLVFVSSIQAFEFNTQMQKYMDALLLEAKKDDASFKAFDYTRGEEIFTTKHVGKKGKLISCTSCHNLNLSQNGKNINTNKVIKPLSPNTNQSRFTEVKEVKKWLRRNFNDVYVRKATAKEKGDVITYIINKK